MRNDKKLGGALMAIAFVAASTVVEAGKGNGGGRQGGGYSTGGSSMSGSGYTYNYGSGTRNDNQYQHRHQHQYRHKHGSACRQGGFAEVKSPFVPKSTVVDKWVAS